MIDAPAAGVPSTCFAPKKGLQCSGCNSRCDACFLASETSPLVGESVVETAAGLILKYIVSSYIISYYIISYYIILYIIFNEIVREKKVPGKESARRTLRAVASVRLAIGLAGLGWLNSWALSFCIF